MECYIPHALQGCKEQVLFIYYHAKHNVTPNIDKPLMLHGC